MSFINPIKVGLLAVGLITVSSLYVAAQQPSGAQPPAPRLFRPGARTVSQRYVPQHRRQISVGRLASDPVVSGDETILYDEPMASVIDNVVPGRSACRNCGGQEEIVGAPVDQFIDGQFIDGDACGCGAMVENFCGGCNEIDCRDCCIPDDCWLGGLGGLLYNAEYFSGVQGFKGQFFGGTGLPSEPAAFGYNLGFNTGLPFYKLTCGLVSGQLGLRSVQSSFEGDLFTNDRRDQIFFTGGLYRRVDYGLQFGVVVDYLREEWITEVELAQMRGELSWVYPAGHAFGFRFAKGIQDDPQNTPGQNGDLLDTYRFFYRHACQWGGHSEFFSGWSDESHWVIGADYDIALGRQTALQTGFTYLNPEDNAMFLENDTWNITLGVSWRPRGRGWYKFYHRPLLPVADNGSLIIRRQ